MKPLSIGEVARRAEVGIETIRFYEREGLVAEPPRRKSGYRQYPEDAVFRIQFIKRAKDLGFSLKEIKDLLFLRIDPKMTCAEIQERAQSKIQDVEEKIRALQRMRKALRKLAAECPGEGPASECPVLEALEAGLANRKRPGNSC